MTSKKRSPGFLVEQTTACTGSEKHTTSLPEMHELDWSVRIQFEKHILAKVALITSCRTTGRFTTPYLHKCGPVTRQSTFRSSTGRRALLKAKSHSPRSLE